MGRPTFCTNGQPMTPTNVTKLNTSHQKSSKTIWLILRIPCTELNFQPFGIFRIFLSISPLTERPSNSIKLTYSRFSQQIYINLYKFMTSSRPFIFSITGPSLLCVTRQLNPGTWPGQGPLRDSKGHRKAQSSRHNVWRARQDPSGTPVECPLGDSRRCPGRRLETYRNDRRPCHGQFAVLPRKKCHRHISGNGKPCNKNEHIEHITHTCSETSYRITDVECIVRAKNTPVNLTGSGE